MSWALRLARSHRVYGELQGDSLDVRGRYVEGIHELDGLAQRLVADVRLMGFERREGFGCLGGNG